MSIQGRAEVGGLQGLYFRDRGALVSSEHTVCENRRPQFKPYDARTSQIRCAGETSMGVTSR